MNHNEFESRVMRSHFFIIHNGFHIFMENQNWKQPFMKQDKPFSCEFFGVISKPVESFVAR